ncbi:uncharacterized protein [Maniola hyperantus]|uniref:uncharacterized protein isoform X1 n=2 Tax=Aphantopus hyperantus TaxID=2795564 RepID=UPI0015696DBD|nr:uncharacterized protein LOC117989556 isoform X1 [Maniola hyperantus]
MKNNNMALPMLRRCCGCLSLEKGCLILSILSTLFCIAYIIAGSWYLPQHKERKPEDNLISMTILMFATLSAISNVVALMGVILHRPGCLQLSQLFNSVFILCIFLVAVIACLFSPELQPYMQQPGYLAAIVIFIIAKAVYYAYYVTIINSLYRKMKMYGDTALPI